MAYIPPRPFDDGTPEAAAYIAIWERLWGSDSHFINTPDIQFQKQANGKYIAKVRPTRGGGGGVMLQITGEWDPGRTYNTNEVAIISMGSNAGTYVYINSTASGGHAPYAGGGWWMQLPGNPMGVWM